MDWENPEKGKATLWYSGQRILMDCVNHGVNSGTRLSNFHFLLAINIMETNQHCLNNNILKKSQI